MPVRLSVVIPTLDSGPSLSRTLDAVAPAPFVEVIVVDGGSRDDSATLARALGAKVIAAGRGLRGRLTAGARAASAEWLLFLHPSTVLGLGWGMGVGSYIADPANRYRAALVRFADDTAQTLPLASRGECGRALMRGEDGLLISRELYDSLGGHRPFTNLLRMAFGRRLAPEPAR